MNPTGSEQDATMAVYLDLENLVLGAEQAQFPRFNIKLILERLLLRGDILVKKAYCDFERYKDFRKDLHEQGFELIEIPHVRQSGKNSADIRMVVDALDLCYTKPHLDTFIIISGDSDFSPLVGKLRENAKTVVGVGVKKSSSDLFIKSCKEFIYYDDLARKKPSPKKVPPPPAAKAEPISKVSSDSPAPPNEGPSQEEGLEQLVATLAALEEERGKDAVWGSMLKPAMKRRNPGFSEGAHGFSSFNEMLITAGNRGLIKLTTEGKSKNFKVESIH